MNKRIISNNLTVSYQDMFNATLRVLPELPFKKEWENGTGNFDPLAKLHVPRAFKTFDSRGRPIMMIPSPNGTIVVYKRFINADQLYFHVPVRVKMDDGDAIVASCEDLRADLENLGESAQDRQLEARMAILCTAIQNLHNVPHEVPAEAVG